MTEMQVTDRMSAAADEYVEAYNLRNYEAHKLAPSGLTIVPEARKKLVQAAFSDNAQYSAVGSKQNDQGQYEDFARLNEQQLAEAKAAFNTTLQTLVSGSIKKLATEGKLDPKFTFHGEDDYYGRGIPPNGVPAELMEDNPNAPKFADKYGRKEAPAIHSPGDTPAIQPQVGSLADRIRAARSGGGESGTRPDTTQPRGGFADRFKRGNRGPGE